MWRLVRRHGRHISVRATFSTITHPRFVSVAQHDAKGKGGQVTSRPPSSRLA